ncbi:MAG: ATP-binding protein [Promethearchaeota archaeon]
MAQKIGIILNYQNLPDVSSFPFVISRKNGIIVKKGLFIYTYSVEGFLIGVIEKIILLNEYFSDALTIKSYNSNNNPNILKGLFPSEDFEFAIAIVKCLGIIQFEKENKRKVKKILRMTYPASPGESVFLVNEEILNVFLGFDIEKGLMLGSVKISNFKAKINMNRLLNKHFAILAVSGAGKSYLTSIIIEELLTRNADLGTPALFLIDVHGEYTYLKSIPELSDKINVQDVSYFQISVPYLNAHTYRKYQDKISYVQIRELSKYINDLKKSKKGYTIQDLMDKIEQDEEGNKSTKIALLGWLTDLYRLNIFGPQENPILENILNPQQLTILDLSKEISIRKKQIIVDYICNRLFYLRRSEKVPPFLLIIEEAHQFCPEAAQTNAISKSIIETISREGRKFMACLSLISQRPKKLSTTALSQLNSKLILNIKNPYDLKHLMDSSEAITKNYTNIISSLGVGEMLLMGNAVNYPIFIDIRERYYKPSSEDKNLSDVCLTWQKKELL